MKESPAAKRKRANSTGHVGVSGKKGRFVAKISSDGKCKYLGTFSTKKEAAIAYDQAAMQRGDAPTQLNFPDTTQQHVKKIGTL